MELENHQALETDFQAPPINPDLLFAWLSPIEKKADNRSRTKSPSETATVTHSPFLRAKSAIRRTFRGSVAAGVPVGLKAKGRRHIHKLRGAPSLIVEETAVECMSSRKEHFVVIDLKT